MATCIDDPVHHRWLAAETDRLLDFYRGSADPGGGFRWLDDDGRPAPDEPVYLWITARMAHCFAVAHLMGVPGAAALAGHGLAALEGRLRDPVHDGWFWSIEPGGDGPVGGGPGGGGPVGGGPVGGGLVDGGKQAYGHAFVLLAAASAAQAELPGAGRLLRRTAAVIDRWFWRPAERLCVDAYTRDWQGPEEYRCANTAMHLAEAYLATAEVTGDRRYAQRAAAIAGRVIGEFTAANDWRLPVHFDAGWRPQLDYHADRPFDHSRPYGSTVGHWLEWIRVLLHLHARFGSAWLLPAAARLFDRAVTDGWDERRGGFVYTVDWSGRPVLTDRMHWVVAEAIGAAVGLYRTTGDARYDRWYATFWEYAEAWLIDRERGSWIPQLDAEHRRVTHPWHGKPDLYHAMHATLFARLRPGAGIAMAAKLGIPAAAKRR
jgi:sulfoquinovose isomerase